MATGTSRRSACTMVFIVLLDFAEFLKLEIFSFAVISTTSFRLALLRIGPVFNCFMDGQFYLKQFICHAQNNSCNMFIINNLCAYTSWDQGDYRFDFVPIAGTLRPIFGIPRHRQADVSLFLSRGCRGPQPSRS